MWHNNVCRTESGVGIPSVVHWLHAWSSILQLYSSDSASNLKFMQKTMDKQLLKCTVQRAKATITQSAIWL